jgi:hypothetical protein
MPRSATVVALATLALPGAVAAQFLIAADSATAQLVAFNPFDGSVIDPAMFAIANTTHVAAIDVNGEIWLTEQLGDRITRRDFLGTTLGTIGPTFAGGGLDNIRGLAFVNGLVYVTNGGNQNGATANSVVVLDPAGNHVQTFSVSGLANSPFAVLPFQGELLVSGFNNNRDIYRFTLAGNPIGVFHDSPAISPAHGLALAGDGNVWCVGFTTANVCKLDATTGAIITSFPVLAGSAPRGVFELGNGNVMWTNSFGVHVYDVVAQTSSQVFAGTCNHISLYGAGSTTATAAPYGAGCGGLSMNALGLPLLGNTTFALRANQVPPSSPIAFFAFGSGVSNPGIDLTGIGMPGCSSYTSFDLGLFGGSPASGGFSTFGVPIPNDPLLTGVTLATQGVSFSTSTALGLASSNGVTLVLGS